MSIAIIGGGTTVPVRPHFSLSAPAYGSLARKIHELIGGDLYLTRMAGGSDLDTNEDLASLLDKLVSTPETRIVFMTAAVCDWRPIEIMRIEDEDLRHDRTFGKDQPRLKTVLDQGVLGDIHLLLHPTKKLLRRVRQTRKDIFLVACKTTTGANEEEMFLAGLRLLKSASCNLVLVNDLHTRANLIVTPEQAVYGRGQSRDEVVAELVEMTKARSAGQFTRSTIVDGSPVPWTDKSIHPALRAVVDHCIQRGAYRDLLGQDATVGHFAQKLGADVFLTSRRKTNFNHLDKVGMVRVEAWGDDEVIAYGSKPSVGGQSQRAVFRAHPEMDCIVHAHISLREGAGVGDDGYGPIGRASQRENECGSHQCGDATAKGLREVAPGIKAVMLDKHGPNVVFHHSVNPADVITYMEKTFDFSRHTGME